MKIKTRFAPSPTGNLHIGGIRTALYSWLFARSNNGKFVLRIEDTDFKRSTPKAIANIIDNMKWLNLNWDEGPYYQTKRFNRYSEVINTMLQAGTAYKCYCSKERLEKIREKQIKNKLKFRYDGKCRNNNTSNILNKSYVVRFRNPQEGSVILNDYIRGSIKFNNKELDDLIIQRSDGSPTYNFCVAIDDWDMDITHVIRGEDHINNTPRQINILKAIGANIPIYVHVSMLLDKNGKKLSKRYNSIGVTEYRNLGYLPESLLNYLLRLGWSYGNQEIFSISEMKEKFNLNSINKSSCIFNATKLEWLNHYFINTLPAQHIEKYLLWHINERNINLSNGPKLTNIVILFRKSCKTLKEIADSCEYFYKDSIRFNLNIANKYLNQETYKLLSMIRDELMNINFWNSNNIKEKICNVSDKLNMDIKTIYMTLRIAITGVMHSPSIDLVIEVMGYTRVIARIERALLFINKYKEINLSKKL